jgi:hypothetical protein
MAPQPVILFLDIRIQVEVDCDWALFFLEDTSRLKADAPSFLPFNELFSFGDGFCFFQSVKCSTHVSPEAGCAVSKFACNHLKGAGLKSP